MLMYKFFKYNLRCKMSDIAVFILIVTTYGEAKCEFVKGERSSPFFRHSTG